MSDERKNAYRAAYLQALVHPVTLMEEACESEIERLFFLAAIAPDDARDVDVPEDIRTRVGAKRICLGSAWSRVWAHQPAYPPVSFSSPPPSLPRMGHVYCDAIVSFWLVPQWPILVDGNSYRLDFAVFPDSDTKCPPFAIELDGHDFHERTKAQAARDRSRDRALSKAGWRVLRFTGSELWRDPTRCARDMRDAIAWEAARQDDVVAETMRRLHETYGLLGTP